MLANRRPKSVPGTRCDARSDASKQADKSVPSTRCGARSLGRSHLSPDGGSVTRAAVHRLAADGYGKRDKGRPKSVPGTGSGVYSNKTSSNLSKAASPVVYGISGRCSAARPPCLRPPTRLYLLSASGDLGIPDWELRARRKPRMRKQSDGAYGIRFAERQSAASPR